MDFSTLALWCLAYIALNLVCGIVAHVTLHALFRREGVIQRSIEIPILLFLIPHYIFWSIGAGILVMLQPYLRKIASTAVLTMVFLVLPGLLVTRNEETETIFAWILKALVTIIRALGNVKG